MSSIRDYINLVNKLLTEDVEPDQSTQNAFHNRGMGQARLSVKAKMKADRAQRNQDTMDFWMKKPEKSAPVEEDMTGYAPVVKARHSQFSQQNPPPKPKNAFVEPDARTRSAVQKGIHQDHQKKVQSALDAWINSRKMPVKEESHYRDAMKAIRTHILKKTGK